MQRHVKNYMRAGSYGDQDVILCEICKAVAVDIHHIDYRSQGGSDEIENLVALCRYCHGKAHAGQLAREYLFELVDEKNKITKKDGERT